MSQLVGTIEFKADDNYPPPENPTRFNERLKQDFGEIEGFARYRVVWGQDERYKLWQAGKPRLRYVYAVQREERLYGATIIDAKNGKSRFLNFKQMANYQSKPGELIAPQIEIYEKEIGEPFFWLEYYASPAMLGSEEDWNLYRWIESDQQGHKLDLTGPYPKNGRYEPLLRLSAMGEEFEEYRPINDNTYDWIRSMLQGDKQKLAQALKEQRQRFQKDADEIFSDPHIDREVADIKKRRLIYA